MKKGDKVISAGDQWIGAGSIGIVNEYKNKGSVFVKWDTITTGNYKPGIGLFHKENNLIIVLEGARNPNIAFKLRK